ncbi:MAG: histidine--tRNA ligase [Sphingobacteriales bacterium UTBCD1]|jgi:histidyl-tRNA synthetase|nr:MAG: histidine--tRNA ligase [Sphingobacteriales bacterium UTBCD1]
MTKPSLPQGTRDFEPETVRKRNYIFNSIKTIFERYGFQPLETPAMENLETLMGKYGEEGDKLIFKILNNGLDNPEKQDQARKDFENILMGKNSKGIAGKALKYDLTIPFARYVATNHKQLTFPFKRYQVQPVWRADRPQKGRYREFYQCDADVVGSESLLNEKELANIYHDVFHRLGIRNYELKINHRKILTALAELCGGAEKMTDIAIAIDKLDKIGLEKVKEELSKKEFTRQQITVIENYLSISGTNAEKLSKIKSLLNNAGTGEKGIKELEYLVADARLAIDFTLARGLNYYTGIIFEAKAKDVLIGSIGGGGRYDDLTGLFGVPNIPGVGISFGVDRIYDVMEELNLFPASLQVSTQVLFFNLGEEESNVSFSIMQQLRHRDIRCELYHENAKFDKQFKYAERKKIPYIIIIGSKEIEEKTCTIKNISTGEQKTIYQNELISSYQF